MFPVSASGLGRFTTEPTVLGGYLVPASTEVQACSHSTWSYPVIEPSVICLCPQSIALLQALLAVEGDCS
jgi:hypothetical protein